MNQTVTDRPVTYREHSTQPRFIIPLVLGLTVAAVGVLWRALPAGVSLAMLLIGGAVFIGSQVWCVETYNRLRDERAESHPEERSWREHPSREYWIATGWRGLGTAAASLAVFGAMFGSRVLGVISDWVSTTAVVVMFLWNAGLAIAGARYPSQQRRFS